MIYLIDDNKNNKRVNEMKIHYVDNDDFKSILKPIEKLKKNCDLSFLKDAECILIHKTTDDCDSDGEFIDNSNTNALKIIEEISEYGEKIPLVIFSNRMDEKATYSFIESPNCIFKIKKSIFYIRLYDFLSEYKTHGKIELRIIAHGKNFRSEESDKAGKAIIDYLLKYSLHKKFDVTMVDIDTLRSFYSLLELEDNFDVFFQELQSSSITVKQFVIKITQALESIEQYGKYIYNWKK